MPDPAVPCLAYLECQLAVDVEAGTTVTDSLADAYGPVGTCWTTTPEAANACSSACVSPIEATTTAYPDVPECSR